MANIQTRRPKRRSLALNDTLTRSQQIHQHQLLKGCRAATPRFIQPMKCKLVESLPNGGQWFYELKLDGFRALAVKGYKNVQLISRNRKDLSHKFPELAKALSAIPGQAVIDGEIVALDKRGRPSFQALQNLALSGEASLFYCAFDLLNLNGRDITRLPLEDRRALLEMIIPAGLPRLRFSRSVEADATVLLNEVRKHALEGIIAKKAGSFYEPGQRTGAWIKYKNLLEQEFVIGGYTPPEGTRQAFGALLVGFHRDRELHFASKVGTGFTAAILKKLYKTFQPLRQTQCPFINLPETSSGRWGQGLTRAQMSRITWLEPKLVAQVAFTEWTEGNHLRHPVFKGLREDKDPKEVIREYAKAG